MEESEGMRTTIEKGMDAVAEHQEAEAQGQSKHADAVDGVVQEVNAISKLTSELSFKRKQNEPASEERPHIADESEYEYTGALPHGVESVVLLITQYRSQQNGHVNVIMHSVPHFNRYYFGCNPKPLAQAYPEIEKRVALLRQMAGKTGEAD